MMPAIATTQSRTSNERLQGTAGFRRKPLALLISGVCLQAVCLPAFAVQCPAPAGNVVTLSGAADETCNLGAGQQLQVTGTGSLVVPNSTGSAVLVDVSVAAHSIGNAGTIDSPYTGGTANGNGIRVLGTLTNGIVNSGTITASSDTISIENGTVNGGLTNSATGTIGDNQSYIGVSLVSNAVLSGGIDNAGQMNGQRGLSVDYSIVNGDIRNRSTGQIGDPNGYGYGILVRNTGSALNGNIVNEGAIDGGEGAIIFDNSATMTGSISNTGDISGAQGISFENQSILVGDITNTSGSIFGNDGAIVLNGSAMTGTITNSGTLTSQFQGTVYIGSQSTLTGNISNVGNGLIDGGENAGLTVSGGSTVTGGIANAGTITSTSSHATIGIDNSTVTGVLNNTGVISNTQVNGGHGVQLANGSTLGALVNAGTISSVDSRAVSIEQTTVSQGITNSGTISGRQGISLLDQAAITAGGISNTGQINGDSQGIVVDGSTVNGGITNSAAGTIIGVNQGLYITQSTITGNIDNSGLIDGLVAVWLSDSTIQGDLINRAGASITDAISGYAVLVQNESTIANIDNSGIITGTNGIGVTAATVTGAINNRASGSIAAEDGFGIEVRGYDGGPTQVGGIVNGGSISGKSGIIVEEATVTGAIANEAGGSIIGTDGAAILLTGAASVGGINNGGTLTGSTVAIDVETDATLTGGIVNSGTLTGNGGAGIRIAGSGFSGNIENSGTITGAGTAIDLGDFSGPAASIAIDNSGVLNGAALFGAQTLNLNGNSSRVLGAIDGTGMVNINGTFAQEGSIDAGMVNIANTGLLQAGSGLTATGGLHNAGTLSVTVAQPFAVTGDYTQSADGIFLMQASTPTDYSRMTVSGNAALAPLTHIQVDVTPGATLVVNGVLPGVITAGSLDASTFTVTDNSFLFNFIGVVNGNAVDLNVKPGLTVYDSVVSNGNFPGSGAARTLDELIRSGTATGDMATVISALGTLTTSKEVSDAVQQTLPVMTGGTSTAVLGAIDAVGRIVQARQEGELGLSSGDEYFTDRAFWLKPFGSWSKQSNRDGVAGFETNGGGLVAGIDGGLTEQSRLGLAFAYAHTEVDSRSAVAPQGADIDTYQLVFYGTQTLAPRTDLNYQIDFGVNDTDTSRHIDFGGLQRTATADYSGWAGHAAVGIGHLYSLGTATTLTPSVRIDYARLENESYTEGGADALNLEVDDQDTEQLLIGVDAKLNHEIEPGLDFTVNAGAAYDALNDENSITSTYAGGGAAFATRGLDPSPWIMRGGFGLIAKEDSGFEVSARYDVEARPSDFLNQSVSIKFRVPF